MHFIDITKEVIDQLLNMNVLREDTVDDEYNVPITPVRAHEQPVRDTTKDAKIEPAPLDGAPPLLLPRIIGTAIKIENPVNKETTTAKKKVFKTV